MPPQREKEWISLKVAKIVWLGIFSAITLLLIPFLFLFENTNQHISQHGRFRTEDTKGKKNGSFLREKNNTQLSGDWLKNAPIPSIKTSVSLLTVVEFEIFWVPYFHGQNSLIEKIFFKPIATHVQCMLLTSNYSLT